MVAVDAHLRLAILADPQPCDLDIPRGSIVDRHVSWQHLTGTDISAHATVVVASAACGEHDQQENEKPRLFS